jgi:hypothetical protein
MAALLPTLLLSGLLLAGAGSTPASDDGPVVQMTVTPSGR